MLPIDFGRHSDDYAVYRPGMPVSFFERLEAIVPLRGCAVLDLGTGPGTIALELASRGSSVVGVDISQGQIAAARRLATERGLAPEVRFEVARAEDTGLPNDAFDLVIAGHCWHWLEVGPTLAEVRRVLRPGGLLVIAYHAYLAARSRVARDTEALVLQFNPAWGMAGETGCFPEHIEDVRRGGLRFVEAFWYDHDVEFTHARWRGRMRTCNGVGSGGMSAADVRSFDTALGRLLADRHPEPLRVAHRVWAVVGRNPDGGP